jgi:hypothetical protein
MSGHALTYTGIEEKNAMIIFKPSLASGAPRSAYAQLLRKRTMTVFVTPLVAIFSVLACVTVTTAALTKNHATSISSFPFAPCGNMPGVCP